MWSCASVHVMEYFVKVEPCDDTTLKRTCSLIAAYYRLFVNHNMLPFKLT